jgi:hypothetical protein
VLGVLQQILSCGLIYHRAQVVKLSRFLNGDKSTRGNRINAALIIE